MSDFTPEQKLDYWKTRVAYWEGKLPKLLSAAKKARAKRRIAHYKGKIEAAEA